ncbi:hypothetical protein [Vulcanisaeta sp. JCM 16161]|uniref:hypothetical protein n=1 Tax=Vulcanisaeta sp. JCM 16161 TaxID=1295372 RepID=UPI001FB47C13|nr:hypothetical protein [Vulcanisaeta sp. JCM 16161]
MSTPDFGEEKAAKYDAQLRRALNFWDIAYLEIGSMIGSGWMFAPLLAASVAGPASIVSWIIAGILVYFIAEHILRLPVCSQGLEDSLDFHNTRMAYLHPTG